MQKPNHRIPTQKETNLCFQKTKNLRDILCNARVPHLKGDVTVDPGYIAPKIEASPKPQPTKVVQQTSIMEFAIRQTSSEGTITMDTPLRTLSTMILKPTYIPSRNKGHRGYSYYLHNNSRYCSELNKTGTLKSTTTGLSYNTMKKVSCRSFNLIYAKSNM